MKHLFLLDPDIIYLNHGSFGATPIPVFETYQEWQRKLETQPVRFLGRELNDHFHNARQVLGEYLNANADDLVYLPNVTYAVNLIARSIELQPGDEILATDNEYGACERAWSFICQKTGTKYIKQPINLPVHEPAQIIEQIWGGVSERTRLIFISHITSPTAIKLPVKQICSRAQSSGILTMIDGAHAPGQIEVDLQDIQANFYAGNCHKWMMAPKGSAFLYANRDNQELLEPLVVSWGWQAEESFKSGSEFIDFHQWYGTHDPSACLSVPAAIKFQNLNDWDLVRHSCHQLVEHTLRRASKITGLPDIYPQSEDFYHQMAVIPLPDTIDPKKLQAWLYNEAKVEIPCYLWEGTPFVRISIQGYNTLDDVNAFLDALEYALSLKELKTKDNE